MAPVSDQPQAYDMTASKPKTETILDIRRLADSRRSIASQQTT